MTVFRPINRGNQAYSRNEHRVSDMYPAQKSAYPEVWFESLPVVYPARKPAYPEVCSEFLPVVHKSDKLSSEAVPRQKIG